MDLKLSVWSGFFGGLSPEEAVDAFIKNGIFAMELSRDHGRELIERGNPSITAREFKKYISERNFTVNQGHLVINDVTRAYPDCDIEEQKRWIEFFSEIGIKNMVLHLGRSMTKAVFEGEELAEKRLKALAKLTPLVEGSDKYICLENIILTMTSSGEILQVIKASNSKNLAVCLDTGHLNNYWHEYQSHYKFIKEAGSYIRALHINDNEGREQHFLPYSCALSCPAERRVRRVDFEEVMRGLKEIGYSGEFNFEVPGEADAPMPILSAKLQYMKAIADYLLGLY